ncbi:MAG: hypothetical protein HC802_10005 [Caldilineaceae bacterium]|nr:hypothetical protein [Caldilineaceae bacterium]
MHKDLIHDHLALSADEVAQRFEALQNKLEQMWRFIGWGHLGGEAQEANTIVVVTSISVDVEVPASLLHAYEERFLFLLFLLRQPSIRMIYITSQPIDPHIVEYYLHILPGVVSSSARKRLRLVSPRDGSSQSLTAKLLHARD